MSEEGARSPESKSIPAKKGEKLQYLATASLGWTFKFLKTSEWMKKKKCSLEKLKKLFRCIHSSIHANFSAGRVFRLRLRVRSRRTCKKEPGGITTRCVHPRLRGVGDRSGIRKLLCPFRQGTPECEFTQAFASASELASCRVAAAVGGNRLSLGWFYG